MWDVSLQFRVSVRSFGCERAVSGVSAQLRHVGAQFRDVSTRLRMRSFGVGAVWDVRGVVRWRRSGIVHPHNQITQSRLLFVDTWNWSAKLQFWLQ